VSAPDPTMLARWYRRVSGNIEDAEGNLRTDFAGRGGCRLVEMSGGTPVSSEHDKLGAAVYRLPLSQKRPGPRGGRPTVPVWKQRRIVRLLAAGVPRAVIAVKVHTSNRTVDELRARVRRWKDPDDQE